MAKQGEPPSGDIRAGVAAAGTALAGMLAWYGLTALTGREVAATAWALGALVGLATFKACRQPSRATALLAAACTALAIVGGSYLAESRIEDMRLSREARKIHAKMLAFAPRACAARTQDEIRQVIAELNCEDATDKPDLEAVSEYQMAAFDCETRPRYRGVLDGNPTRDRFVGDFVAGHRQRRAAVLEDSLTAWTFLWLVLGSSTAYALAAGLGRHAGGAPPRGAGRAGPRAGSREGFRGRARP